MLTASARCRLLSLAWRDIRYRCGRLRRRGRTGGHRRRFFFQMCSSGCLGIHYRGADALALERAAHVERRAIGDPSDIQLAVTDDNSRFDDEPALGAEIIRSGRKVARE